MITVVLFTLLLKIKINLCVMMFLFEPINPLANARAFIGALMLISP